MKYEITNKTRNLFGGTIIRQIRATKNFADVKAGDLGGWIQSEDNLNQYGNCWIYNDAIVMGNAFINSDAKIAGEAMVKDTATVTERSVVGGFGVVGGDALLDGNCWVNGHAQVSGKARLGNGVEIYDYAQVGGKVEAENLIFAGNTINYNTNPVIIIGKDTMLLDDNELVTINGNVRTAQEWADDGTSIPSFMIDVIGKLLLK